MTPRERWLAVLNGEKPDRLPMDYWGTPEATAKLCRHMGCDDEWEMYRKLRIDRAVFVSPLGWDGPKQEGVDKHWGYRWARVEHQGGAYFECVEQPLAGSGVFSPGKAACRASRK